MAISSWSVSIFNLITICRSDFFLLKKITTLHLVLQMTGVVICLVKERTFSCPSMLIHSHSYSIICLQMLFFVFVQV